MVKLSNITYDKGTNLIIYKVILQENIDLVLKNIGISDENIKWIIFDEADFSSKQIPKNVPINILDQFGVFKYGLYNPATNEIRISTAAIRRATPIINTFLYKNICISPERRNFLADVIMDELAHATTKKNHGDSIYEEKLQYFRDCYYNKCKFLG